MSKFYICSPLHAETEEEIKKNMERAKLYMQEVTSLTGVRCVAPHAFLPEILDDNNAEERQLAIEFGLALLKQCSGIVVCGDRISSGMAGEIETAKELGLPIFYFCSNEGKRVISNGKGGEASWRICLS